MIVVLGSRHDVVANELVARWPGAALCSAEDLVRPGWVWPAHDSERARWVVDGEVVPDARVSGVFVRRSTLHTQELLSTHPDDRGYLAAEIHAFLSHVLARTRALVVNPVDETGAYGEAALAPERWMTAAAELGVEVVELRLRSCERLQPPSFERRLQLVSGQVVDGAADEASADAAARVCLRLGLRWAVAMFDDRERLAMLSTTPRPSTAAAKALAHLLGAGSGV